MHNEAKAGNLLPPFSRQLKQTAIVVYQLLIRIIGELHYYENNLMKVVEGS